MEEENFCLSLDKPQGRRGIITCYQFSMREGGDVDRREATRDFIVDQCRCWPELEPQDLLKALHQSVFGCGHYVEESGESRLVNEMRSLPPTGPNRGVEPMDGPYCRLHLRHAAALGLSPRTLFRIFYLSAQAPRGTREELEEKLELLLEVAKAGGLPWTYERAYAAVKGWRDQGCPAVHHSELFQQRLLPAYRVIRQEFVWMLPLLSAIDQLQEKQCGGVVAIDGGAAAGKTTLGRCLKEIYDCQVYHMDDFFLRPEQRTPRRLAEPGGNVDRERFMEQVLLPVSRGEPVCLQRYDCKTQSLCDPVMCDPKPLTIIEGAYAAHPALAWRCDLSVFVSIDPELQTARIAQRNTPEEQERFREQWIPMENAYFAATNIADRCDLHLEVKE